MSDLGKQRLLKLADFLEKEVEPRRLNMWQYAVRDKFECLSHCCALGWAATIPEFKQEGLGLCFEGEDRTGYLVYFEKNSQLNCCRAMWAAEKFFELSFSEAAHLFFPKHNKPQDLATVVARIRTFAMEK